MGIGANESLTLQILGSAFRNKKRGHGHGHGHGRVRVLGQDYSKGKVARRYTDTGAGTMRLGSETSLDGGDFGLGCGDCSVKEVHSLVCRRRSGVKVS